MVGANLVRRRRSWPKLHEYVVEQCARLPLLVLMAAVPEEWLSESNIIEFAYAPYRGLRLVPRQHGPCKRWWVQCPTCGKRRDTLYRPPPAFEDDWRCRVCHGLIYASQRYSPRHPLRRDPRNWFPPLARPDIRPPIGRPGFRQPTLAADDEKHSYGLTCRPLPSRALCEFRPGPWELQAPRHERPTESLRSAQPAENRHGSDTRDHHRAESHRHASFEVGEVLGQ